MDDYMQKMRTLVGHETVITIGCGILVINSKGQLLMQQRRDSGLWGIPGGLLNIEESIVDCAIREVQEESGLIVSNIKLFGIYSGFKYHVSYPSGDKIYSPNIIFISNEYTGELKTDLTESLNHNFFSKDELPDLHHVQKDWILDWANGVSSIVLH